PPDLSDLRWLRDGGGKKGSPYRYYSIDVGVTEFGENLSKQADSIPASPQSKVPETNPGLAQGGSGTGGSK
ncbi:MAG: hypothetical protein PVI86_06715, partial [Phycisphaerae bacterium]